MKSVFNSLGSNYTKKFEKIALKQIFFQDKSVTFELKKRINPDNPRNVILTYKGRHAITLALKMLGINKSDEVVIQAFTCWAVEEAVQALGAVPRFIDVGEGELNLNINTLLDALKKYPKIKAIIVQHTFGFSAEIEEIKTLCVRNNIALIEDLAHGYGGYSQLNQPLGSFGDAKVLSFGRDKIIDGVSGGAVVFSKTMSNLPQIKKELPESLRIRDLLYPFTTNLIRKAYNLGIGKYLHFLLKQTPLLVSPIANISPEVTNLPTSHAKLAFESLEILEVILKHRQEIAHVYQNKLKTEIQFANLDVKNSSCLRFPIKMNHRDRLFSYLKQHKIYLADTWFKQPVEHGSLSVNSKYEKDSCPNAQKLSLEIVNLPTHRDISQKTAHKIANLINKFLENDN